MQVVIDIPEERYKDIQRIAEVQLGLARFQTAEQIIANGIPLPKGHGRLKDADALIDKLCTHEASELFGSVTCAEILEFINDAQTIIEADTEGSDSE